MATEYRFGKPTIMDSFVILPDGNKSLPSRSKNWPNIRGDLAPKDSTDNLWLHTGSINNLL